MTTTALYQERKGRGVCVLCTAPITSGIKCQDCRDKINARQIRYRNGNREYVNAQARKYIKPYSSDPEKRRASNWYSHLKRKRG